MKNLWKISIVLWAVTFAFIFYTFYFGFTSKSSDSRIAVRLNTDERDMVLGEMRTILSAVNGVLIAAEKNDSAEASRSAKSAGMAMAVDINPAFMAKLPVEFKKMGMGLHKDFDQLAYDLEHGMTDRMVIKRLGQITQACIACHSAYRLQSDH